MFGLVAHRDSDTNLALVDAAASWGPAARLTPRQALGELRAGDVALARLDVRADVDGVEPGLWTLGRLATRGVRVLNPPSALLTAHDKLLTARELTRADLPHPVTRLVLHDEPAPVIDAPVVVKPRFGSWGRDVVLCRDQCELEAALQELASRRWFATQGALVQDLMPPSGYDLRLVVAGGQVVGAIRRRAAKGEWRTNVALGGAREPVEPPLEACAIAMAAAAAAGADLVGVDLLPVAGSWVILELNGAVDFTSQYSEADPHAAAIHSLAVAADLAGEAIAPVEVLPVEPALEVASEVSEAPVLSIADGEAVAVEL
jgi:RimK family alpha-L-glutamate ligase